MERKDSKDPNDDMFLDAAIEGKVNYLISQDKKHLLPLKEFKGVKIIEPRDFLNLLR